MVFLPSCNLGRWIEIGRTMCILSDPKFFLPPVQFISRLSCLQRTRLPHPLHCPHRLRLRSSPPWPCLTRSHRPLRKWFLLLICLPLFHIHPCSPLFLHGELPKQCQTCPNSCVVLRRGVRICMHPQTCSACST
jgi:hypothetical protein